MKKILIGLLAVSSTIFSQIEIDTPANETNSFTVSQTGKIKINFKSVVEPSTIKYVVFANTDDIYAGSESELTLPNIILTQTSATNVMVGVPSNIYVRRVNSSGNDIEGLGREHVTFTVNFDSNYTGIINKTVDFTSNKKVSVVPTALMSQAELNTVLSTAVGDLKGAIVNIKGEIEKEGKIYSTPKNIEFYSDAEGVLKVRMVENSGFGTNAMSSTLVSAIEKKFATEQPFNALTISVAVN